MALVAALDFRDDRAGVESPPGLSREFALCPAVTLPLDADLRADAAGWYCDKAMVRHSSV